MSASLWSANHPLGSTMRRGRLLRRARHKRPQCPNRYMDAEFSYLFWRLSQLPSELFSQVLEELLIPPQPCLDHLFGTCSDPWGCTKGSHLDIFQYREKVIPWDAITSLSPLFHYEGYKKFFQKHTFVFQAGACEDGRGRVRIPSWPVHATPQFQELWEETSGEVERLFQKHRDHLATRYLEFVDYPECTFFPIPVC